MQTGGGASGSWWAHDHWNLPSPPDIVTFSKKMLVGGYYFAEHMRIKEVIFESLDLEKTGIIRYSDWRFSTCTHERIVLQGYRIYNTWCGDPSKLILLEKAVEVIKRDNLLDRTKNSGVALQKGLNELQVRFDLYMYSELCPRGRNL